MYVICRVEDGKMVSIPGSEKSYTASMLQAAAALSQQLAQQGLISPSTHAAATLSAMAVPAQSPHKVKMVLRASSGSALSTYMWTRTMQV